MGSNLDVLIENSESRRKEDTYVRQFSKQTAFSIHILGPTERLSGYTV